MAGRQEEQGERAEPLLRVLREVEDEIRGLYHEVAYIIDPNGNVTTQREGTHMSVDLPIELMRGRIVTHNHPRGTSFSVEDIQTLLGARAAEIRAVSVGYDYSMKLPPDTEWEDVELLVTDVCRLVFDDLAFETRMGRMSAEEFDRAYMHRVWT